MAQAWYHIALVAHITGLTLMAGATLADFILFRQFWKQLFEDRQQGLAVRKALSLLPRLIRTGTGLLVLSGVGMMALTQGVFGEQVWFRIKFTLLILIIVNALAFGRRQNRRLSKVLLQEHLDIPLLQRFKKKLRIFHMVQLTLFLVVFTLSVFKFN